MICEIFNQMGKFVNCVLGLDWYYRCEVKLWEPILMAIMFLITLFILSWWVLPIRLIFKRYGHITFYCKNNNDK